MTRTTTIGYLTMTGCFGSLVAMLIVGLVFGRDAGNVVLGLMAFSFLNLWAFTRWGVRRQTGLCPCCVDTINDPNHDWMVA